MLGGWRLEALVKYKIQMTKSTQATQPKPSNPDYFPVKPDPSERLPQLLSLADFQGMITSFIIHYRVEAATPREDETEADG